MPIIAMIASGLFTFFNRIVVTSLFGKAIFLVITTWVISVLLTGIVGMVSNFLQLPSLSSVLSSFGNFGQFMFWIFTKAVRPGLTIALASRVVVFTIRRLPVVG